jgi:hypothetical protein
LPLAMTKPRPPSLNNLDLVAERHFCSLKHPSWPEPLVWSERMDPDGRKITRVRVSREILFLGSLRPRALLRLVLGDCDGVISFILARSGFQNGSSTSGSTGRCLVTSSLTIYGSCSISWHYLFLWA